MLFYTGVTRSATAILVEQSNNVGHSLAGFHLLRDLAGSAVDHLRKGDVEGSRAYHAGELGGEAQLASGVTNPQIDSAVELALAAGASGCQGHRRRRRGFLLVICPTENQRACGRASRICANCP